jgi:hypothetical protein
VPSITLNANSWTAIGPSPIHGNAELGFPVGRTEGLAPDPANANVMYLAADHGGIWKTSNWLDPNGPIWTPETDNQSSLDLSSGYQPLAVAPSNDQVIYGAASGPGGGILRSQDGGQTWSMLANGQFDGATLGSLAVDSSNPNTVYLSVWGGVAGGIYKSTDGGVTWNNLTAKKYPDAASDVVIDPFHPNVLYAGLVGGSNAGIYKTTDGGTTWNLLNNGVLSGNAVGSTIRLALASAPAATGVVLETVYATVFDPALGKGNNGGGLPHQFVSADDGASWKDMAPTPGNAEDRTWHVVLAVDQVDATDVYVFANSAYSLYVSLNNGPWAIATTLGDDFVGMAFDQAGGWDPFGDRSIYRSTDKGHTWTPQQGNLQITLFYDITLDPGNPNNVYGIAQDQVKASQFTGDPNGVWNYIGGGDETGKILIDPNNPQRVYEFDPLASDYLVMTSDDGGQHFKGSLANFYNAGNDYSLAYATQHAFAMDPGNPDHLSVTHDDSDFYETFNGGKTWYTDGYLPVHQVPMNPVYTTSLAIVGNTFYAGASDGSFWTGTDMNGAAIWTEADTGLKGVASGNVVDVRINPSNAQNVVVVTDGGSGNNVWLTFNGGSSWINVSGDLPAKYPVATVAVDWPQNSLVAPLVFVGTIRGVYVSFDIPASPPSPPPAIHWTTFDIGLPNAWVRDLEIAPNLGILAAGTFGRGAWEILLSTGSSNPFTPHLVGAGGQPITVQEVSIAGNPSSGGGSQGRVLATFTDPNGASSLSEYRATLQWGTQLTNAGIITLDTKTGVFSVHIDETALEGSYPVSITVSKDGTSAAPVTVDVVVRDAPLAAAGASLTAVIGQSLSGSLATVQDRGGAEDPSHYAVAITWGDGTPVDTSGQIVNQDGVLMVQGNHTYLQVGLYRVKVTIVDQGGSTVSVTSAVLVTKTAPPTEGFAARAGGTGANAGLAIATDNEGNIYVAGQFQGPADFPAATAMITLPGFGHANAFVAKYSSAGQVLWVRALGGPFTDKATGIAVDALGNVYVTGTFQGTALFGGQTFTALGISDAFVAKLDGSGNFLWSHQFQELTPDDGGGVPLGTTADGGASISTSPVILVSPFGDTASGIVVDGSGSVYVTGTFNQQVDFGGPVLSSGNSIAAYVAKLNASDGSCLWAEQTHGEGEVQATAVALDGGGNVFTVASFRRTTGTATTEDAIDLQKMTPSGTVIWARPVVQTTDARATALTVDPAGDVLVTGYFLGTGKPVDFNLKAGHGGKSGRLTPARGTSNIFVVTLAPNGKFNWVRGIGGDVNFRTSTGIAVDHSGHVYVTGYFHGAIVVGSHTVRGDGPTTAFVAELSSSGNVLLAASEGGEGGTEALAIALDPTGFAILTGEFGGTTQIGAFPPLMVGGGMDVGSDLDAAAGTDIFVAKLKLRTP